MNGSVPVVVARRAWRWWGVLRVAVVLLWLLAAAASWWTGPREQSYDRARADVAAGRVTAYQWGDYWDAGNARTWFGPARLHSSGTLGPLFVWRTPDGRVRWTNTDHFGRVKVMGTVDEVNYSGPGAMGIAQDVRAAGLERRSGGVDPFGAGRAFVGLILGLVFLGVVVAGPAPTRGTRWYWFWLVAAAPYGLGLLYWLARERPWSPSAAPAAEAGGPDRRSRGILGLGLGVVASILVSLLLLILHSILGDRWVPYPDASGG
ncbi:MAG TPA: hypothetical protein VES42_12995 [Pilimelia sp.]|nr:hypothetical protein [Pilimelia sp.]